jgi:hypothetical protein
MIRSKRKQVWQIFLVEACKNIHSPYSWLGAIKILSHALKHLTLNKENVKGTFEREKMYEIYLSLNYLYTSVKTNAK